MQGHLQKICWAFHKAIVDALLGEASKSRSWLDDTQESMEKTNHLRMSSKIRTAIVEENKEVDLTTPLQKREVRKSLVLAAESKGKDKGQTT